VKDYGEARFLQEIQQELSAGTYRVSAVRRVHIPKPGQPGRTRPLGIPTLQDRTVQISGRLDEWLPGQRPKTAAAST